MVASEACSGCSAECTRRFISQVCVGSGTASANAGVAGVASDGVASASAGVAGAASDGVANGSGSGVLCPGRRLGSGPGRPAADGRMGGALMGGPLGGGGPLAGGCPLAGGDDLVGGGCSAATCGSPGDIARWGGATCRSGIGNKGALFGDCAGAVDAMGSMGSAKCTRGPVYRGGGGTGGSDGCGPKCEPVGACMTGTGNKGAIPCMGGCSQLEAARSVPTGGCSLEAAGNGSGIRS